MTSASDTSGDRRFGLLASGDELRVHFTIAGLGGSAASVTAISAAVDRFPRPSTAVISSAEDGLQELEVRLIAGDDDVTTEAVCNERLHVALQLDATQLSRYQELGWSGPCPERVAYVSKHEGTGAVQAAVEQMLDTLVTAIGFDGTDELELTISR